MRTLILNGSPHRQGDTAYLTAALAERLPGEVREVWAYAVQAGPCVDCRSCWQQPGCALVDGMQEIYRWVEESDCIVIASPLYFSELTGPLLTLCSRLQCLYANRRFLGMPRGPKKRGGVVLAGGGDGGPAKARDTAACLLRLMNAEPLGCAETLHTDDVPAREDGAALAQVARLAVALAGQGESGA